MEFLDENNRDSHPSLDRSRSFNKQIYLISSTNLPQTLSQNRSQKKPFDQIPVHHESLDIYGRYI